MEKRAAPPPKRKHVVMWTRMDWYGYKRHELTVTLVRDAKGLYSLYVSGRKLDTVHSIGAAQYWYLSKVKYYMDELDARIIAGGVYYGGQ